jgi:hypothetical protein
MILLRTRPVLRRVFGRKLTWNYVGHAPTWRPYLWHNPGWVRMSIGSRRHHLSYNSSYLYWRRLQAYQERHCIDP